MTPMQILRVGLGNRAVSVPIYRVAFAGGADSNATPGGFFTNGEGELGIALDARLDGEEAQRLIATEIERNLAALEAFARRSGGGGGEPRSHAS